MEQRVGGAGPALSKNDAVVEGRSSPPLHGRCCLLGDVWMSGPPRGWQGVWGLLLISYGGEDGLGRGREGAQHDIEAVAYWLGRGMGRLTAPLPPLAATHPQIRDWPPTSLPTPPPRRRQAGEKPQLLFIQYSAYLTI